MILFLQAAGDLGGWSQLIQFGPTVVMFALLLFFLIRLAPTWREIRLRELDVREQETVAKVQQATALSGLADALKEIAVEQRRSTEELTIMQRVTNHSADELRASVNTLTQRVDGMESRFNQPSQKTASGAEQ